MSSHVPIVHGAHAPTDNLHIENEDLSEPFIKGEVQPPAYRDVSFAYAFLVNIIGVFLTTAFFGPAVFQVDNSESSTSNDTNEADASSNQDTVAGEGEDSGASFLVVLLVSFLAAILTTMGLFSAMSRYAHAVVHVSFMSAPILLLIVALIFMPIDAAAGFNLLIVAAIFGTISALVYFCYRRFVPFAASTLRTAIAVVRYHKGLYFVSFGGMILSFFASIMYALAFMGIGATADKKGEVLCKDLYDDPDDIYGDDEMCMVNPPNTFAILLLLLSLFWTQQVIQNVVHCTTAGTVGTWWFSGLGDPSCCSHDITSSLGRSVTYSFGSICFGSLLVAILQTLEYLAKSARRNRRGALLACIIECILSCMRAWLEYFNSWTFCYVGLYGYDYLTAGKNVVQLFQNRGWGTFASDRLIFRVLYASQLAIALVCGGVAALTDAVMVAGSSSSGEGEEDASAEFLGMFFIGFFLGLLLSRCSLFVLESAVRTVIVCFAESPADFQEHHPGLCEGMRQGWAAAYPEVWSEEYDLRFAEAIPTVSSTSEEKKSLTMA